MRRDKDSGGAYDALRQSVITQSIADNTSVVTQFHRMEPEPSALTTKKWDGFVPLVISRKCNRDTLWDSRCDEKLGPVISWPLDLASVGNGYWNTRPPSMAPAICELRAINKKVEVAAHDRNIIVHG